MPKPSFLGAVVELDHMLPFGALLLLLPVISICSVEVIVPFGEDGAGLVVELELEVAGPGRVVMAAIGLLPFSRRVFWVLTFIGFLGLFIKA